MDDRTIPAWHLARRVPLPVTDAASVLDHLVERGSGHIKCRANAITLSTALVALPAGVSSLPVRRLRGVLHVGGLVVVRRPIRVEVELVAWSRSESELGVRPMGRPPRAGRALRYFDQASALLTELAALLACDPAHREADGRLRRAS